MFYSIQARVCSHMSAKGLSHYGKIALAGSRCLHSTLAAVPVLLAHAVVTEIKNSVIISPSNFCAPHKGSTSKAQRRSTPAHDKLPSNTETSKRKQLYV